MQRYQMSPRSSSSRMAHRFVLTPAPHAFQVNLHEPRSRVGCCWQKSDTRPELMKRYCHNKFIHDFIYFRFCSQANASFPIEGPSYRRCHPKRGLVDGTMCTHLGVSPQIPVMPFGISSWSAVQAHTYGTRALAANSPVTNAFERQRW